MVAMNVWPTDGDAGSVANEAKWRKMARHWAASGVLRGVAGELAPTYSAGVITVQPGAAWIDGHYAELVGAQAVPVTTTGIVVVRFDPVANTAELVYRDAITTPTQNPVGVWELVIARMATVMIDLRAFAGPTELPWSAAWGRISTAVLTTASGNAGPEIDVNGATATWTPVAGRAYSIGFRAPRVAQATSAGEMRVRITDGANVGKGAGNLWSYYANGASFAAAAQLDTYETGLSAVATTRKARTTNTGPGHTFDWAVGNGLFWVEDVGPAGARPTALESLEWLESREGVELVEALRAGELTADEHAELIAAAAVELEPAS